MEFEVLNCHHKIILVYLLCIIHSCPAGIINIEMLSSVLEIEIEISNFPSHL